MIDIQCLRTSSSPQRLRRTVSSQATSFDEMLDAEGSERVNADSPRERQLVNIRRIYGPGEEALGVLAIEIGPAA